jgi:hypothetical protein
MNLYFCLYSNEKFEKPRKSLYNLATKKGIFKDVFEYDRKWLETTGFYLDNIEVLGDPNAKGDGWCLWKPYIILESLKNINDGDVLLYMDASDTFFGEINKYLEKYFLYNDILLVSGGNQNKIYTKRDTFHYMGCDSEPYWNSEQVEAGIIGIKKSDKIVKLMEEYLQHCRDPRIIKDGINISGYENFQEFKEHKYDQSVLTNIKTKYSIYANHEIRRYVECNMWEARTEDINEFNRKVERISSLLQYETREKNIWETEYLDKLND